MECVAFIKPNNMIGIDHGTHNGYVAVPPTNKYHGKSYYDIDDIEVHGGITYSEPVTVGKTTFMTKWKVDKKYIGKRDPILRNAEFITENTEIGDDWWIFGFDTFHFGDDEENWDRNSVITETMDLLNQFEKGSLFQEMNKN